MGHVFTAWLPQYCLNVRLEKKGQTSCTFDACSSCSYQRLVYSVFTMIRVAGAQWCSENTFSSMFE